MSLKKILKLSATVVSFSVALELVLSSSGIWVNLTSSMPQGVYHAKADRPLRNDYVLSCLPEGIAATAKKRGYVGYGSCPAGTSPIGKKMIGMPGDLARIDHNGIMINGVLMQGTAPRRFDGSGNSMPAMRIERNLSADEYILATSSPRSYDSRYFGPVHQSDIRQKIEPLYLF